MTALAAVAFGVLVGGVHYGSTKLLGDEVYASKSAVGKTGLLTATVAGAGYYLAGGPPL